MHAYSSAHMTPANLLYLYDLLAQKIGFGRQVTLEQAAEVLAQDDVLPQDVGYETPRALFESEHFKGVAKVDVFKKGRIYATPQPNEAYDAILERLASPVEETSAEPDAVTEASIPAEPEPTPIPTPDAVTEASIPEEG